MDMMDAGYWHVDEKGRIQCELCPHACVIAEGRTGRCRVRGVRDGGLKALAYGCLSSVNVDPIEKKPLYHYRPGSEIFSIGGWGCNFHCVFCQNWQISQEFIDRASHTTPEQVMARATAAGSGSIAYTYNEPLVGLEFALDCARLARKAGLANVLVTNGYVCREPAAALLTYIDAVNLDIKSLDNSFYETQCGGSLAPVLAFARQVREAGCHIEVTNLVIPGLNSDEAEIRSLAEWVHTHLGKETPLHLSAYFPRYKLNVAATPVELLERAYEICAQELTYVYLGNVGTVARGHDTRCPDCGALLVERRGYAVQVLGIRNGNCAGCGRPAGIVMG
jgi:pyruvate formate lyase activating enzyme